MAQKQQHVDIFRKFQLRRTLLKRVGAGAVYVPFIGEGDIAAELYGGREVFGADINPAYVATARARLPEATIEVADCDGWPFNEQTTPPFAVADFDAWCYPYDAFRAFWEGASKAKRLALFFTDGERAGIRTGSWRKPEGQRQSGLTLAERRPVLNFYASKIVQPYLRDYVRPWRVVVMMGYLRKWMYYWGAVVER